MANICRCPSPPGGMVVCSPNQIAICSIKDGQIQSGCIDVIRSTNKLTILNFTLSTITRKRRYRQQQLTSIDVRILRSGKYTNSLMEVTFKLPLRVVRLIPKLDIQREGFSDGEEFSIE